MAWNEEIVFPKLYFAADSQKRGSKQNKQIEKKLIYLFDLLILLNNSDANNWIYYQESSIVQVVRKNLHDIIAHEIFLDEWLSTVLFFVLVHVIYLLNTCLLDDLCATETGIVCCIQSASLGFINTYLNDRRLFCMEAKTLVQLLPLIVITSLAAHFITRSDTLRSSIVPCRYNPILIIYDNCSDWCLHTIWSSSGYIRHFHKILIPCWPEISYYLFLLGFNFLFQLIITSIYNPGPYILKTFIVFWIVVSLI